MSLDSVAIPLFDGAHEALSRQRKAIRDERLSDILGDKLDEFDEQSDAYYESLVDEQAQVIGAAALAYVCSALHTSLRSMCRYFKDTHPAKQPYPGKAWLMKTSKEFMDRFGIDLANSPVPLDRIEELFLGRNAGIHWENEGARKEYRTKMDHPRFIDEVGNFAVRREKFIEAVDDSKKFIEWIHSELKKLRHHATGANQ